LGGQGKSGETETDWALQLLAYADDVNLLGDNTDAINDNTET
jgi:hypothetical protein